MAHTGRRCPKCHGRGIVLVRLLPGRSKRIFAEAVCEKCQGMKIIDNPNVCQKCNGSKKTVMRIAIRHGTAVGIEVDCDECRGSGAAKTDG